MKQRMRTGLEIIGCGLIVGIVADSMFRHEPWGLNIFILIAVFAAVFVYLKKRRDALDAQTVLPLAGLLVFSALFMWRDSEELRVFNVLAILLLAAVLMLPSLKVRIAESGVVHFAIGAAWSWLSAVLSPFLLLFKDINPPADEQSGARRNLTAVVRGGAVALPFLLIFGALFTAADAGFEGLVDGLMSIKGVEASFEHAIAIAVFSWLSAGYLRNATRNAKADESAEDHRDSEQEMLERSGNARVGGLLREAVRSSLARLDLMKVDNSFLPRALTLGAVEVGVVLGLVNILFVVFVSLQIPYLFGGFELVQNTPDFKLSEYARRGFGELVAVAVLVVPMLLGSHWLMRRDDGRAENLFRSFAVVQILLLFAIMASAMHRLLLLTGSLGYGMTSQRFFGIVFIVWLAIVFVWFVATVLFGRRERFATGALVSALLVLGIVHSINPDRFIVRANLILMSEGRPFDGGYNGGLGSDAVPELLAALPSMDFEQQCLVRSQLREKLWELESEDSVLSFNISRSVARDVLQANRESFDTSRCAGCLPHCKRVD